ncbi:hypothetical protein [Oceanihabitans sediminis]|uniref:hypothetical protein n=1 Tax=Oceanihabitans sediminis TaxID=1812012 RepID=UPI00299DC273|nr:hypothetical protein [Oceanihabitans sediminis]MDX1279358.1 hypothetical protein [Oceanihabitans sediminis]
MNTDPDTKEEYVSPIGLEHQGRRKSRSKEPGRFLATLNIPHYIINLHQESFPELTEKMKNNPNAINIYSAFLMMIPLEIKGTLTPEIRRKILDTFNLI